MISEPLVKQLGCDPLGFGFSLQHLATIRWFLANVPAMGARWHAGIKKMGKETLWHALTGGGRTCQKFKKHVWEQIDFQDAACMAFGSRVQQISNKDNIHRCSHVSLLDAPKTVLWTACICEENVWYFCVATHNIDRRTCEIDHLCFLESVWREARKEVEGFWLWW